MFFDLTYNVKERIINTLRMCFNLNPNYRHVLVTDKYPLKLKKLPAIVIKNASTPIERAGVDDYIKDIETRTGEVMEVHKKGTSIKSVHLQENHLLYCVRQPEVFHIQVLENNQVIFIRQRTNKRIGPITVVPGSVVTDLIYDVEIAFDDILIPGDFSTIMMIPIGGSTGKLYGGLFEMELSMTVMAESTPELEEITDWTIMYLWFIKKPDLEREHNILIRSMRHTGETEVPEQKNFIYTAGIDIALRSQWSFKLPARQFITSIELIERGEVVTCEGMPISLVD